jgi:hypothetical protein
VADLLDVLSLDKTPEAATLSCGSSSACLLSVPPINVSHFGFFCINCRNAPTMNSHRARRISLSWVGPDGNSGGLAVEFKGLLP